MAERCVVCGQPLPAGVTAAEMHRRIENLGAEASEKAAQEARRDAERNFNARLASITASIRKQAAQDAAAESRKRIAAMEKQIAAANERTKLAVSRASREARAATARELAGLRKQLDASEKRREVEAEKAAKRAASEATRNSQKEISILKDRSAKERARYAADSARLKARVDELSLKLERQSSEQMGEMSEADALVALQRAFPHDDVQRIGKGIRGADILHRVMNKGAEVGRIVYECKNVSTWQNDWLTRAKGYRSQYQTPWVIIASRCFPRREKTFVVESGVPVIELRLIARLATVIRAAVVEVGSLRLTTSGRHAKAAQMFEYILSDHFASRFLGIAEAVDSLRTQQDREKRWHEEAWAKETLLHDDIESGRREIEAQVRAIAEAQGVDVRLLPTGGNAREVPAA